MTTYDAIVIGTGQAGPALARRLAASGMQVAIIERGRFGGTCINTGCTPTKALVASPDAPSALAHLRWHSRGQLTDHSALLRSSRTRRYVSDVRSTMVAAENRS